MSFAAIQAWLPKPEPLALVDRWVNIKHGVGKLDHDDKTKHRPN
jgi:hypothetical protein